MIIGEVEKLAAKWWVTGPDFKKMLNKNFTSWVSYSILTKKG